MTVDRDRPRAGTRIDGKYLRVEDCPLCGEDLEDKRLCNHLQTDHDPEDVGEGSQ